MVSINSLAAVGTRGTFEVRSKEAKAGMMITICTDDPASPLMTVSTSGPTTRHRRPLASVVNAPPDGKGPGGNLRLEIKSKDGASAGLLEEKTDGKHVTYVLSVNGVVVMVVEGADDASLQMRVLNDSGKEVATLCCTKHEDSGEEIIQLAIMQGNDPILVVTTALAVLLLGEEDPLKSASSLASQY